MSALHINNNNFQEEVMNSEQKVLIDFWAPWCGPCQMVLPIIDEIAAERSDIKVCKINVDENPELAKRFRVMSIPTLIVMEKGEIVNIDNTGNRVAATLFGPKKVYIILGRNKIVPTLEAAIDRARNIASPMNARRYNLQTPCAQAEEMRCYDCSSSQRLCRAMVIHMFKPKGLPECEVLLINEDLGF